MLFHAELDAEVVAGTGALRHRLPDLLQNLLPSRAALIGHAVWEHANAEGADILRELKELLGPFDVLPQHRRVGIVVLICARQADREAGSDETLLHFGALRRREGELDAMLVRRAQLYVREPGFLAVLDNGGNIPALPDLIRHQSELQRVLVQDEAATRRLRSWSAFRASRERSGCG